MKKEEELGYDSIPSAVKVQASIMASSRGSCGKGDSPRFCRRLKKMSISSCASRAETPTASFNRRLCNYPKVSREKRSNRSPTLARSIFLNQTIISCINTETDIPCSTKLLANNLVEQGISVSVFMQDIIVWLRNMLLAKVGERLDLFSRDTLG